MKNCQGCGAQMEDDAKVCPNCGKAVNEVATVDSQLANTGSATTNQNSALKTAAKIFMILGCISSAFCFLIPLCWTLPMTFTYFRKVENHEPVGIGFKICVLLFVNLIAGVLMFFDNQN